VFTVTGLWYFTGVCLEEMGPAKKISVRKVDLSTQIPSTNGATNLPLRAIVLFGSDNTLVMKQRCSTSNLTISVTGHDPKPVQSQSCFVTSSVANPGHALKHDAL
jgi:hypothetical protein